MNKNTGSYHIDEKRDLVIESLLTDVALIQFPEKQLLLQAETFLFQLLHILCNSSNKHRFFRNPDIG